jgi:outer membrane protein TolC
MNLKIKYFLTFLFLGLFTTGFGQEKKDSLRLSLADAQNYALQNNRSVKNARIDLLSADKRIWETIAMGLPQLGLSANYQHQFVVPELSFGSYLDPSALPNGFITNTDIMNAYKASPKVPLGVPDNTTFDFTLSQLIFSGEYIVGLQATKVFKEISVNSLAKTEATTRETIAGTYYLYLVLGESLRVLEASRVSVDQTYKDAANMNKQGFNEETDVDQIKISLSNIERLAASVKAQRDVTLQLLKYQLGMEIDQPIVLSDSLSAMIKEGNIQYLAAPVFDYSKSIDYKIVRNLESSSALFVRREQSKYLPTISAFYRRHEQTHQPSFNFAVKDLVGVGLNIPLFTSGTRTSKVGQAKFDLEKAKINSENAAQGLTLEFESALSTYQTAYGNFLTNSESIVLSRKVYLKTLVKYKEGISTSFELSQNQNQFLNAEQAYYNSILSLLTAKAKLDRILTIN